MKKIGFTKLLNHLLNKIYLIKSSAQLIFKEIFISIFQSNLNHLVFLAFFEKKFEDFFEIQNLNFYVKPQSSISLVF